MVDSIPIDQSWAHYFPFANGSELRAKLVVSSLSASGTTKVERREPRLLAFSISIPEQWLLWPFKKLPASNLQFEIEYKQEGMGNAAKVDGNFGAQKITFQDDNVSILSYPSSRRRRIDPSIDTSEGDLRFDLFHIRAGGVSQVELRDIRGAELPSDAKIIVYSAESPIV